MGSDHSKTVEFILALTAERSGQNVPTDEKLLEFWKSNKNDIDLFYRLKDDDLKDVDYKTARDAGHATGWQALILYGKNTELLKTVIDDKKINILKAECYNRGANALETVIANKSYHSKLVTEWTKLLMEIAIAQISPADKEKAAKLQKEKGIGNGLVNLSKTESKENQGESYLQLAAFWNSSNKDLFFLIADNDHFNDVTTRNNKNGDTILHTLMKAEKLLPLLREFLASGKISDMSRDGAGNIFNNDGLSPLMLACMTANSEVVKELLANRVGGTVDARSKNDPKGFTALHFACGFIHSTMSYEDSSRYSIVEVLLTCPGAKEQLESVGVAPPEVCGGLDANIKDEEHTPLSLAVKKKRTNVVNCLILNGAKKELPAKLKEKYQTYKAYAKEFNGVLMDSIFA